MLTDTRKGWQYWKHGTKFQLRMKDETNWSKTEQKYRHNQRKEKCLKRRRDWSFPAMSWVNRHWNLSSHTAGPRRRWWPTRTARAQSTQAGDMKQWNGRQIQVLCSFFPNCCVYERKLLNIQYEEWQNQQQLRKHKLSIQWGKLAKFRIFPPLEIFQTKSFHNKDPWLQARPKKTVKCKLGTFCMSLPPDCIKLALWVWGWCNAGACPSAPKNGKEKKKKKDWAMAIIDLLAECWQSGCKNG
jgi:hypothetical protein